MMPEELQVGAFAQAYREAEERRIEAAAEEERRLKAAALAAGGRIYDPMFYPDSEPHDPGLYEGTGIGALYEHAKRMRRTDREVDETWHRSRDWIAARRRQARWLSQELGEWQIGREHE